MHALNRFSFIQVPWCSSNNFQPHPNPPPTGAVTHKARRNQCLRFSKVCFQQQHHRHSSHVRELWLACLVLKSFISTPHKVPSIPASQLLVCTSCWPCLETSLANRLCGRHSKNCQADTANLKEKRAEWVMWSQHSFALREDVTRSNSIHEDISCQFYLIWVDSL